MNKRTLSAIAAAIVIGGFASSYASPYLTMHQMHSAMMEKDADAFSSNADFPSVRESLQAQFMTVVRAQISNSPELKDNPFAGLGMMLATSMVNQMINTHGHPSRRNGNDGARLRATGSVGPSVRSPFCERWT